MENKFTSVINILLQVAEKSGHRIYAAGGYVRDIVLGREPKDLDILVDADRGGIIFSRLVSNHVYGEDKTVVFERFGTAMLNIDGLDIEFVMPRAEKYFTSSRNPDTSFSNIQADAFRRDFTINSMFMDLKTGEILDYTGFGKKDIAAGIIRTADVDNDDIIFYQDPLRILRAFKFAGRYEFKIYPKTYEAIKQNAFRLEIVAKERILKEFSEILVHKDPRPALEAMIESGVMIYIIPELMLLRGLNQSSKYHSKDALRHTLDVVYNVEPVLTLRIAALLHDIGKFATFSEDNGNIHFYFHEQIGADMAVNIMKRMKFPADILIKAEALIRNHMRVNLYDSNWSKSSIRRLVVSLGDNLDDQLRLSKADITSHNPKKVAMILGEIAELEARISEIKNEIIEKPITPLLNGYDLMQMFNMPSGGWIKIIKDILISSRIENSSLTLDDEQKIAVLAFDSIKNTISLK